MTESLLVALALILVIEGALYALFPQQMKKILLHVLGMPLSTLRTGGLLSAAAGVLLVWLIRG